MDGAFNCALILCDNIYRRIESSKTLGSDGVKISIPTTGNISAITQMSMDSGNYAPTGATYKAAWYGKRVVTIDRFFPSSQLCSSCGTQWSGAKDLSVRRWECPTCGALNDRDLNAAKNILNEGLRLLA